MGPETVTLDTVLFTHSVVWDVISHTVGMSIMQKVLKRDQTHPRAMGWLNR